MTLQWTDDEKARFNVTGDEAIAGILVELITNSNGPMFRGMSTIKKEFTLVTAAATLIERSLCEPCGYDEKLALEALDRLIVSMRRQIIKRCNAHAL
jgi:hypothetical protein